MKQRTRFLLLTLIIASYAGRAPAHTLSLSTITAEWFNGTAGSNVSYLNNGTADASARWGVGTQLNYLEFKATGQPVNLLSNNTPTANQSVGTLFHGNASTEPGTMTTDIQLRLRANVLLDGVSQGMRNFDYSFNILETPNAASPCADGAQVGVGVDINGCADKVTLSALPSAQDFAIGAEVFRLNLLGFSLNQAGTRIFNFFWTPEKKCTCSYLIAKVTPLRSSVPEPAILPLLGAGLFALAFVRRWLCAHGRTPRMGTAAT